MAEVDLTPTQEMAEEAQRGLDWRKEFGRGGTEVGIARARDISNKKKLSSRTIFRMVSFFARHEVDKEAEGFRPGEDGYPSNGRIAWALWGGEPGKAWANRKKRELEREMNGNKKLVCEFELKSYDENQDDNSFMFEGYASTFGNIDLADDIIDRGAFDETIQGKNGKLPVLWQHNWSDPVGIFEELKVDDKGLFVRARLPKDDDLVRGRIIPQMKVGSVRKMSIGFRVLDHETTRKARIIKKVDLLEISLVTIPANPMAEVTGMKSVVAFQDLPLADRGRSWDSDAAVVRVREFTDSEESPSATYRDAFLWYDQENSEEFGSYKLPIADVIDGKLVAVPRGVFAAAAAMAGARGGVDIPESDRPGVIRNIERYYDKMGLESPFEDRRCFRVDDFEGLTVREMERLFKSGVVFLGEKAKTASSLLKPLKRDVDEVASDRDGGGDQISKIAEIAKQIQQLLEVKNERRCKENQR